MSVKLSLDDEYDPFSAKNDEERNTIRSQFCGIMNLNGGRYIWDVLCEFWIK